jgi:hypothetical protein
MAAGMKHYKRDGTLHTGGTHKMPDGTLHSGKSHGKTSVKLLHYKDLSKKAKEKADAKVHQSKGTKTGKFSKGCKEKRKTR